MADSKSVTTEIKKLVAPASAPPATTAQVTGWHLEPTSGGNPGVPSKSLLVTWGKSHLILFRAVDGALFELSWSPSKKEWRCLPTTATPTASSSYFSSSSSSPSQSSESMARDSASLAISGNRLFLFGGRVGGPTGPLVSDCWTLDLIPEGLRGFMNSLTHQQQPSSSSSSSSSTSSSSSSSVSTLSKVFQGVREFLPLTWRKLEVGGTSTGVPEARYGHSAVVVAPDKMLVYGGHDGTFCLSDLWEFDLLSSEWKLLPPQAGSAPPPRMHHSAVVWEGDLYVFGGTKYRALLNDLWQFRTEFQTWRPISLGGAPPSAPHVRRGHAAVVLGDQMLVYGGHRKETGPTPAEKCANDLWVWDFPAQRWSCAETKTRWLPSYGTASAGTAVAKKPKPSVGHGAASVLLGSSSLGSGQALVVCGGERDDVTTTTTTTTTTSTTPSATTQASTEVWVYSMAKESNSASCLVQ